LVAVASLPPVRTLLVLLTAAVLVAPATATAANPWLERRVINMTHQGGEDEYPSNTMYAYRESLALGADSIELDVQPTKDGHLLALHDASVTRTTGATGLTYDMTLAEVQKLDAAHQFIPGRGTVSGEPAEKYPLRGVRTGARPAPLGYRPDDFRIPTLEEVLRAFPDVPINIEIKGKGDTDLASFDANADLLVALLRRVPHRNLIVVSFQQTAVDRFHAAMPEVPVAPGIAGVAQFMATGIAPAGSVALQVPPSFSGLTIMTPDFVSRAHSGGYAVHVWFSGQEESERVYADMLAMGADGMMPAKPGAFEKFLCAQRAPRPAGNPNHCGGGRAEATARCTARVRTVSRADAAGHVTVGVSRGAPLNHACGGKVLLRAGRTRLGSARFLFPYGLDETTTVVTLGRRARARLRRAPRRIAAVAAARVDDQARERTRKVTVRR
jgi:glycerophosphoryl diester phosphodiesterase